MLHFCGVGRGGAAYIYADAGVTLAVRSNLSADGDVAEVDKHVNLSGTSFLFVPVDHIKTIRTTG